MPLYMDRHDLSGQTAGDVAMAHAKDLEVQDKYGVRYVTYWFDPEAAATFCLVEGPSRDAAEAVHRESHGMIANQVIEVDRDQVRRFLGRIQEHVPGEPYVDIAFRTIMFTDMEGSTALTQRLGDARAMEVIRTHDSVVREALDKLGGSEVKHTGDGIMAAFVSVARAVECSIQIQRRIAERNVDAAAPVNLRVGLAAGEPVTENDDLFGAVVQLAARACSHAQPGGIMAPSSVRDLTLGKGFTFDNRGEVTMKGFDEPVRLFEIQWRSA
jgi:Protein of unknown function (DUF4242)/Adenylate and Guanylate cyclase catalytic domain